MSARTPEWYNDFGKTSYIDLSYIPETFCVGRVGQYILIIVSLINIFANDASENRTCAKEVSS